MHQTEPPHSLTFTAVILTSINHPQTLRRDPDPGYLSHGFFSRYNIVLSNKIYAILKYLHDL